MIKYAVKKWDKNSHYLRDVLMGLDKEQREDLFYDELMEMCVKYILNRDSDEFEQYCEKVTRILIGEYSGSILYVIAPKEDIGVSGFLLSYIEYGSCSLCDTLENIFWKSRNMKEQVDGLMALCKDLVCNIVKPYNDGWRYEEEFATIQEND